MRRLLTAITALGVAATMSSVARANIVYNINQTSTTPEVAGELSPLSDTVVGTITTNGVIGAVQTGDIVSWDLMLKDSLRPAFDFHATPLTSGIWFDTGNALIATATSLTFDFSKAGAVFIIQGLPPVGHGFSSGYNYFCFQATGGPCLQGETIVPDYYAVDGVLASGLNGVVPLNGVPEPATWALMLLGFGGVGAFVRWRRRPAAGVA